MKNAVLNNIQKNVMVCVDSYDDGVPRGRFYDAKCEDGQNFDSLMQLIIAVDKSLDESNSPRAFSKMRSFTNEAVYSNKQETTKKIRRGDKATFSMRVLFRQNSSWQGYLSWLEGGEEEGFRSVLELIFLMNSALDGSRP